MTNTEKREIVKLFTLGYNAYEIGDKVGYSEGYVANVIRQELLNQGTTPQEYIYRKRKNEIETNQQCYDMGFKDGIDFALKVIGDERLKGKVLSEYGKSKNL